MLMFSFLMWYFLCFLCAKLSVLDFARDRKMMSVLCSRKQQEILFCKGAPESIFSRCTSVLCNDDGSAAPMTAEIRAELEERLYRYPVYVAPPF